VNTRDVAPLLRVTSDDFLVKKVNPGTYTQLITPGSPTGLVSAHALLYTHIHICTTTVATAASTKYMLALLLLLLLLPTLRMLSPLAVLPLLLQQQQLSATRCLQN
jgi:hypothetical protein